MVYGTDTNDEPITEIIDVANGSAIGTNFDGKKIFKTVNYWLPVGMASSGGGRLPSNPSRAPRTSPSATPHLRSRRADQ
jgi:hypothetical protein